MSSTLHDRMRGAVIYFKEVLAKKRFLCAMSVFLFLAVQFRQIQQLGICELNIRNIPELRSSLYPNTFLEPLYVYMMFIVEPVCCSELLKVYRHIF